MLLVSSHVHKISKKDCFVVVGSDGLFDFFNNDEIVKLVHSYIRSNPSGDPAKFLLEQLVLRAADNAGKVLSLLHLVASVFLLCVTYIYVIYRREELVA